MSPVGRVMGTQELQYLQSLDSVRAAPGAPEGELQVLLEVTLALALGRVVVIPQADAFGSLAFLRVVQRY